jgi:hypothetical protein
MGVAELRWLLYVHSASLGVVGMHPDQATEPIVACALALGKPWALAPCCVFARDSPHRRLLEPPLQGPVLPPQQQQKKGAEAKEADQRPSASQAMAMPLSRPVILFADFVEYLRRLPTELGLLRAEQIFLPWQGKNCVLYAGVPGGSCT